MTEATATDGKLETIRKLLAMAEDPSTNEVVAETYMAKATELIAKYGVDRALLFQLDNTTDTVIDKIIRIPNPYAMDKLQLLNNIALVFRVKGIRIGSQKFDPRHEKGTMLFHMFGYASDIERTEMLYTSLVLQSTLRLAGVRAHGQSTTAYRKSWLQGFTSAVVARLKAMEERVTSEAGMSTALVLRDRSKDVAKRVDQAYPSARATSRNLSGHGRDAGYQAGQLADLGGSNRLGGQNGRQLGR